MLSFDSLSFSLYDSRKNFYLNSSDYLDINTNYITSDSLNYCDIFYLNSLLDTVEYVRKRGDVYNLVFYDSVYTYHVNFKGDSLYYSILKDSIILAALSSKFDIADSVINVFKGNLFLDNLYSYYIFVQSS